MLLNTQLKNILLSAELSDTFSLITHTHTFFPNLSVNHLSALDEFVNELSGNNISANYGFAFLLQTIDDMKHLVAYHTNIISGNFKGGCYFDAVKITIYSGSSTNGCYYSYDEKVLYPLSDIAESNIPLNQSYEVACVGKIYDSEKDIDVPIIFITTAIGSDLTKTGLWYSYDGLHYTKVEGIDKMDELAYFYDETLPKEQRHIFTAGFAVTHDPRLLENWKIKDNDLVNLNSTDCGSYFSTIDTDGNQIKRIVAKGLYTDYNNEFGIKWNECVYKMLPEDKEKVLKIASGLTWDTFAIGNHKGKNIILLPYVSCPLTHDTYGFIMYSYDGRLYVPAYNNKNFNRMTLNYFIEGGTKTTNTETPFVDHTGKIFISSSNTKLGLWITDDIDDPDAWIKTNAPDNGYYTVTYMPSRKLYMTSPYKSHSDGYVLFSENGYSWKIADGIPVHAAEIFDTYQHLMLNIPANNNTGMWYVPYPPSKVNVATKTDIDYTLKKVQSVYNLMIKFIKDNHAEWEPTEEIIFPE